MRFGHFFYPMNIDASRDYEAIEECLLEAELVEQLGFDAIWIAEHHFIGEAVYGDPLGFAAAVAVKTQRVIIGLGIILVVCLLALGCRSVADVPQGQSDAMTQPLAALMYLWFGFDLDTGASIGGLKSSHWNTDLGIGSRVGLTDEPAYGFYASDDPAVIAQQLASMEQAGINTILVSWHGWGDTNFDGNVNDKEKEAMQRALIALMDYISSTNAPFKVAVLVLQRQFREGCGVMPAWRRGAWHGSVWPVRYCPAYPQATAATRLARTVPGAAFPAPPGRPAAS